MAKFTPEQWTRIRQTLNANPTRYGLPTRVYGSAVLGGPDFGVFDFVNLFSEALHGKPFAKLAKADREAFVKRFEHSVSDHMPLWFRIPLPDMATGSIVSPP